MMVASGQLSRTHPPLSGTPLSGNTDFSLHQYRFRCPEAMGIHIESSAIHPDAHLVRFHIKRPLRIFCHFKPGLAFQMHFPFRRRKSHRVTKFRPGIQMHGGTVGKQQTVFPAIGYGQGIVKHGFRLRCHRGGIDYFSRIYPDVPGCFMQVPLSRFFQNNPFTAAQLQKCPAGFRFHHSFRHFHAVFRSVPLHQQPYYT